LEPHEAVIASASEVWQYSKTITRHALLAQRRKTPVFRFYPQTGKIKRAH
jgi:hypothetical protein